MTKADKKLHFRQLSTDKVSVGEYINGKWHNVVPPFKHDDAEAVSGLRSLISDFERKTGRRIVATFSNKGTKSEIIVSKLNLKVV